MNTSLYIITFCNKLCCMFIILSLFLHLPPFTFTMSDDRIAKMIAQSNAALVATLAEALQAKRAPLVPSLKLSRFMGHPKMVGDPTVAEWLHAFDIKFYAHQTGVKDADRVVALLYHLGGCAREEIICQPERVRQDGKALVGLLLRNFGPPKTVQSRQHECSWKVKVWLITAG